MKWLIFSRNDAIKYSYTIKEKTAIVSISNLDDYPANFAKNSNICGICRVYFDDVDHGDNSITDADAQKIYSFVKEKYNDVSCIIVHCSAGISRSAGVSAALRKLFTGNDNDVFENARYHPNMLCYRKVLEAGYNEK